MKSSRLLLLSLLFFIACRKNEKPVTSEEAKTFATKLEQSIAKRETAFYDNAFSIASIVKAVQESAERKFKAEELKGFREGMQSKLNMGTQLAATLSEQATYQLVRIYEDNGAQHVIFRLYDDGKLNYHDIMLIHEKGEVKIADMFVYATGENLSQTLSGIFEGVMKKDDVTSMKSLDDLKKMRMQIQKNEHEEALATFYALPKDMQGMRPVQVLKLQAAMGLEDSIYVKALDEFSRLYPDNGKMSLMLLDGLILHKDYDEAVACVNRLDSMINKDPLLDYYRALCYQLKEDNVTARSYLEKLNKNMPLFTTGALELIFSYCDTREWEKAGALLNTIKRRRDYKVTYTQSLRQLYPEMEKYITE